MRMVKFSDSYYGLIKKYPEVIKRQLNEIFEYTLKEVGNDNIEAILLIGSTARHELAYKIGKSVDVFGDYEFVIVVKNKLESSKYLSLKREYSRLSKIWNIRSPLFSIDFGVATRRKLKYTPPTLWAYEAKTKGVVVYGRDVRSDLQSVSTSNIDYGNLNELIIVRLWNMLIHLNRKYIYLENNDYEQFIIKFYYCRNILDILTVLLPNMSTLICGYQNRIDFFMNELHDPEWHEIKGLICRANDLKINMKDSISLHEAQSTFLKGFLKVSAHVAETIFTDDSVDSIKLLIKRMRSKKVFKEKTIRFVRRKKLECDVLYKSLGVSRKSILWIFKDIRYELLGYLLFMHFAIATYGCSKEKGIAYLKNAIECLNKVNLGRLTYDKSKTFEENWLLCRESSLDFMMIWFYGRTNTTKNEVLQIMNWSDSCEHM